MIFLLASLYIIGRDQPLRWWSHDFDSNIHFQITHIQTSNPHNIIWNFCILTELQAAKYLRLPTRVLKDMISILIKFSLVC